MAKAKPQTPTEDRQAAPLPEAATGDQTPETGNTGAADAGAAVAAAAPAEAAPAPRQTCPQAGEYIVVIKGPAKGRWRAGMFFGPDPVEVDCSDLTEAQADALASDPELTCMPKY